MQYSPLSMFLAYVKVLSSPRSPSTVLRRFWRTKGQRHPWANAVYTNQQKQLMNVPLSLMYGSNLPGNR
jgi:hypothetical protein